MYNINSNLKATYLGLLGGNYDSHQHKVVEGIPPGDVGYKSKTYNLALYYDEMAFVPSK